MKKIFFGLLVASLTLPAQAFWFGNPAVSDDADNQSAIKLIYDFGQRDVEGPTGSTGDIEFNRLYAQYGYKFLEERNMEAFARLTPYTGLLDLEGSSFDPNLLAFGAGVRWSLPNRTDMPNFGIQASGDWSFGSEEDLGYDNDVEWTDWTLAGGASWPLIDRATFYGGVSLMVADIDLEISGVETNLEEDNLLGGYLGIEFNPNPEWMLGAELHFLNEDVISLMGGYRF